jgi:hypothetical protein
MPAAQTYEPIATTTLGSATGTVTFSSISSAYTDLILVARGTALSNTGWGLKFNNDSGTNYSSTYLEGNGTSAISERQTSVGLMRTCWNSLWTSSTPANTIISIQNYSNSTTFKSSVWRSNNSSNYVEAGVGLWRNTNAINRIDIVTTSADFATGADFTIYGIKAA